MLSVCLWKQIRKASYGTQGDNSIQFKGIVSEGDSFFEQIFVNARWELLIKILSE